MWIWKRYMQLSPIFYKEKGSSEIREKLERSVVAKLDSGWVKLLLIVRWIIGSIVLLVKTLTDYICGTGGWFQLINNIFQKWKRHRFYTRHLNMHMSTISLSAVRNEHGSNIHNVMHYSSNVCIMHNSISYDFNYVKLRLWIKKRGRESQSVKRCRADGKLLLQIMSRLLLIAHLHVCVTPSLRPALVSQFLHQDAPVILHSHLR